MKRSVIFALILAFLLAVLAGCSSSSTSTLDQPVANAKTIASTAPSAPPTDNQESRPPAANPQPSGDGVLKVHFLDVGQADSVLLQFPDGWNMLVDAGNNDDGPAVVSYLKSKGISRIDYLVATHPHEDHIGGMDTVIWSFNIGQVYMPRATTTTKTFEDVLLALKEKGLKISTAKAGVTVLDQGSLKVNFVAPCGSNYEDLNNWSAVTRIQYGSTAFLLAGDAEAQSEEEMLASGANLKANVLKVGHHGSSSSTTPAFLKAVAPKYAVISVGAGNDYGHPHKETLAKLAKAGVRVYRTDRDGTVVFSSDGKNITVKKLRSTMR